MSNLFGDLTDIITKNCTLDPEITEVILLDDKGDEVEDVVAETMVKALSNFKKELQEFTTKSFFDGTNSSQEEESPVDTDESDIIYNRVEDARFVPPPLNPGMLSYLLKVDEVHARCVKTKVTDTVGRQWDILPNLLLEEDENTSDSDENKAQKESVKNKIREETLIAREFIDNCNTLDGFEGVLELSDTDFESIGYGCFEVIRSIDMKARKLVHVPAERIRVKHKRAGYVEITSNDGEIHYQVFGDKVLSKKRSNPITGRKEFYNPSYDGELNRENCIWNLIDKKTGERTKNLKKAANELIFIKQHHPATIHYGIPSILPAIPYIVGNIHIQNYFISFFENNAVPQYAIIIEGARVAAETQEMIRRFFSQEIKKQHHKTLIIPIPSTSGEVKVRFEKLSSDEKEASFQNTKKNNQNSILIAHGVSPAIIGIAETANLGSGKGLSQSENYKNRIILPNQIRWANEITKIFRFGLGLTHVHLEFDPLDIRDMKEEMQMLTEYLLNGVLSINEVRQWAKLGEPIDGGQRAFIKLGADLFFIDDMSKAPSTVLEKLKNTQEALKQKVANQQSKVDNRNNDNEPLKEVGLPVGNPTNA